ncbi:hypothetical protein [Halorussus salinus]|uniref:hypothetical protein n=1 Tax=Halorussus salinus TaxID=1364935 RepID=UPI001091EECE|nr:hypothetical protein [Halorussus salinus]
MAQSVLRGLRFSIGLALLIGLANAVFGLWFLSQNARIGPVGVVWSGIGLTTTVAVPLVLLTRYSLVTPMLTVAVFVYGFYFVTEPTVGEPFVGYVLFWPVLVVIGLLLGGTEYLIRTQFGMFPPYMLRL